MTFSKEQAEQIKTQLIQQIQKTLPEGQRETIIEQIKNFNEEQLEQFLKQNNIQLGGENKEQQLENQKPIFQQIIEGELPSFKIAENNNAIAILEINPLSKGHSIIIPKKQVTTEKIPKSAMTLAQKIAKKIKIKLKSEDIKIETSSLQDYAFINIIPTYKDGKLEKKKVEETELIKLQKKLETKKRSTRPKKQENFSTEQLKKELSKLPKVPDFRIP